MRIIIAVITSGLLAMFSSPALTQPEFARALEALNRGNHSEAAAILKPLAASGHPSAQLYLGNLYYAGKGVPEDERTAVTLLMKSADQGNSDAMYQLGNAYTFGTETPKLVADPDAEAARWYFRSASAGNADAAYSLGLLFLAGKGVEKNEKEALVWMKQAAKNGHKDANSYVQSASNRNK